MTRLKKELYARGIIYDGNEMMMRPEDDASADLAFIANGFLVVIFSCCVLDPVFMIYDAKTLKEIASQEVYPSNMHFFGFNKWSVDFFEEESEVITLV